MESGTRNKLNPLKPHCIEPIGMWMTPAEFPEYQVSRSGKVRRVYKKGTREMHPVPKKRDSAMNTSIELTHISGKRVNKNIGCLIWETFVGPYDKKRYCVTHRNGIPSDNALINLKLMERKEFGKTQGGKGQRMCVMKFDPVKKEFVETYKSARMAAEKNHFTKQAIIARCYGKALKIASDGYDYCFDYTESVEWMMQRVLGTVNIMEYRKRAKTRNSELLKRYKNE